MATEIELITAERVDANVIRNYVTRFSHDMTTAELIGAYRKLVDTGVSTDAEECALLDLLRPLA